MCNIMCIYEFAFVLQFRLEWPLTHLTNKYNKVVITFLTSHPGAYILQILQVGHHCDEQIIMQEGGLGIERDSFRYL